MTHYDNIKNIKSIICERELTDIEMLRIFTGKSGIGILS